MPLRFLRPGWVRVRCSVISRVKLFKLGEMAVVVREIEPVLLCARKDQEIGERSGHTCSPSAIRESDGAFPDCGRDLVVGKECLVVPERFSLGVICDTAPQLKSYWRTPCGKTALEQSIHSFTLRQVAALPKLMHPERAIDENDGH
jgi:hypothetical protein